MLNQTDIVGMICIVWCMLALATPAAAQQRTFVNGGFEQNDPRGPGTPTYQIYNQTVVPEWSDDTARIELWDSGFQNTPAYEGDVFAELNANSPGSLFQEICMVDGETLSWSFAHRARVSGGPNPQTVIFELADASNATIQSLTSQTSFKNAGWSVNTGSVKYMGPSTVVRSRFFTTDPGSNGNFLDDIQFDVSAFAQLTLASSQDSESSGGNLPEIEIFGRVDSVTSIPIIISGGTANGGDYTQSSATVDIPIGLYSGETFPLPISITNDDLSEADDTMGISLGAPSTAEIIYSRPECDGSPALTSSTYTIVNEDGRLEAEKSVAMLNASGPESYAIPGQDVVYTIRITNTGGIDLGAGSVFLADKLPPELRFYNADIDGAGPETNAVGYLDSGSGLNYSYARDVGFSDSTTRPTSIADCDFIPTAGYVETIRFLCFAPQGSFLAGELHPYVEITYRMQIK